ncbi:MAG: polysaccharide biosynthesis tyrosine autokinase [Polyangiaceae bacterium]
MPTQQLSIRPAPSGTPADDGIGPISIALVRTVLKNWVAVVCCTALGLGGMALYTRTLQRIYQSSATIELDPHVPHPLGQKMDSIVQFGSGDYWDNQEYYNTQYKVITSERVLGLVATDLGLVDDDRFWNRPDGKKPAVAPTLEDTVEALRAKISVDPIKGSRLVVVRVEDTDIQRARVLCQAIVATYVEQNRKMAVSTTTDAIDWMNDQIGKVQKNLEASENALHDFKRQNALPSISINEASNVLRIELQGFDEALTKTRTRKQELLARLAELRKIDADSIESLPSSELLGSTSLQKRRDDLENALKERDGLEAAGKGTGHPHVREIETKIERAKRSLVSEVKNIQGAMEKDLAILERQERGEAGLFESSRKAAVDLNMKEIEYRRLDRARDNFEKVYSMLLEREKEADLAKDVKVNNVHVVDSASTPKSPIRPSTNTNLLTGGLFGLIVGLAIALGRAQLDASIKTPDEIETKLEVPFLGLLPESSTRDSRRARRKRGRSPNLPPAPSVTAELTVHVDPLSGMAEGARSVRTNIVFTNVEKPYRSLLVTSTAPGEGKTTLACSLAISMAQGGQRVCIVDCDLRRPQLHRIFDRRGDFGLMDVLDGKATLGEAARPTVVPNLSCIPSGRTPQNPADVLQSAEFRRFLMELEESFDVVVIDSAPLVAVTDSAILSTLTDATVFVIRAGSTTRFAARRGLRALAQVDAPIVGAVLNRVDFTKHEYRYYQQYYYYEQQGYAALRNDEGSTSDPPDSDPPPAGSVPPDAPSVPH